MSGLFGGGEGKVKMPAVEAAKATAAPMMQLSETEKANKRLAASALTQNWTAPVLGKKALLG